MVYIKDFTYLLERKDKLRVKRKRKREKERERERKSFGVRSKKRGKCDL